MAQQRKTTKKKPRVGSGVMTMLAILVLLAAIGWKLFDLQGQLREARAEKEHYEEQVEDRRAENESLTADIEEGVTPEKMEEIARNELGLVAPDEYVFYDTSN